MIEPARRVVLLTGASTGLGLAIARRLIARDRYHVVLGARESSLPRFAEAGILASEHIWIRALDVRKDEERKAVVGEIERELGGVDVLVNNAGINYRAVVEHLSDRERKAQMSVNFLGPLELIRLVLPSMRARRSGRIVNVSSVGGMMAMPTMAMYSASKFALEGASEALWYEVRPFGIHVSLVQPGFIHSESFRRVRSTALSTRSQAADDDAYHAHYVEMSGFIERLMALANATPDIVARKVVRVIERRWPPLRVAATIDAALFAWLRRLLPRRLYHWLLYRGLPGVSRWGAPRPLRAGNGD